MNGKRGQRPHDHESDPAHNDQLGSDWSDEGGATAEGPATHSDSHHLPADEEPSQGAED